MKIKFYLPILLVATACSSEKFGSLTSNEIESETKILELVGNDVEVTLSGTFPSQYFAKHGKLTITPIIRTSKGDIEGESITFYGEDVKSPGLLIVPYNSGGEFSETQYIPYSSEMRNSELFAIIEAEIDREVIPIKQIKLADGVITTSTLVNIEEAAPMVTHETPSPKSSNKKIGTIHYEIERSQIEPLLLKNKDLIALDNLLSRLQNNDLNPQVNIVIFSTSSPDGSPSINKKISNQRNITATNYMKTQLEKYGLNHPIQSTLLDADWEGLYQAIQNSDLIDKHEIVCELKNSCAKHRYKVLKKQINKHPELFKEKLLPPLRKSTITIDVQTPTKSDEWLISMIKKNSDKLTLNDALRAIGLLKESSEKEKAYLQLTKKHPKDWRAYNNLGALYIHREEWDKAQKYLEQSHALLPTPENEFNLGLIALHNEDFEETAIYFSNLPVNKEWREAQGTVAIILGDYDAAEYFYGDIKSNNAGLSQILNKDYSKAAITLENIKNPNDTTFYLKAILGARTGNRKMVFDNLSKVEKIDHVFAESAKKDIEFHKYWNTEHFTEILKQ